MTYESYSRVDSKIQSGVAFIVSKMSFGRRTDLLRRIRELTMKGEFLQSGMEPKERLEAALLSAEVDRVYVAWGLHKVVGLEIDGAEATPELLASFGPEELFREAVAAVKTECGLSDDERKNSLSPSISSSPIQPRGSATHAGSPASS
jgi:hypothetical protein